MGNQLGNIHRIAGLHPVQLVAPFALKGWDMGSIAGDVSVDCLRLEVCQRMPQIIDVPTGFIHELEGFAGALSALIQLFFIKQVFNNKA